MNRIWHDFYGFDSPIILLTNDLKDSYNVFVVSKSRFAIFGTPHKMIVDITDGVVISDVIRQNNTQYYFDYMVI